jgi:hypothetical protein
MDPRFSVFNGTTLGFVAVTIWMLSARLRGLIGGNWPLFYYAGVIGYSTIFPGSLDPAWVYSGLVCTLLMRFEFMGGVFLKIIRVLDIIVLIYFIFAGLYSMTFFL